MGIVGTHPTSGVRLVLERPLEGGPPWRYAGTVFTKESEFAASAIVDANGAVEVVLARDAPRELTDAARRILRAAWKHAKDERGEVPPPRQIQRWRADKP